MGGPCFRDGTQEESEPLDDAAGRHSAASQIFFPVRPDFETRAFPELVPGCFATGAA